MHISSPGGRSRNEQISKNAMLIQKYYLYKDILLQCLLKCGSKHTSNVRPKLSCCDEGWSDNLLCFLLCQRGQCICFCVYKCLDGCFLSHLNGQRVYSRCRLWCAAGAGMAMWNQIKHQCKIVRKYWSKREKSTIETNRSLAEKMTCCQMASVLFF